MDEGVLVCGRGSGGTHRLEVGDSERDEVAIEAKNEAAKEEGFSLERSGGVKGESWVAVGEESGGTEAEVHEDTIGDSGVKWRRG